MATHPAFSPDAQTYWLVFLDGHHTSFIVRPCFLAGYILSLLSHPTWDLSESLSPPCLGDVGLHPITEGTAHPGVTLDSHLIPPPGEPHSCCSPTPIFPHVKRKKGINRSKDVVKITHSKFARNTLTFCPGSKNLPDPNNNTLLMIYASSLITHHSTRQFTCSLFYLQSSRLTTE